MASIAFDITGSRDASKPPISQHPAFPAVVALWFAALLGLGSMVLPVALIERIVEITGASALVPAASSPLGFTARLLIALASAIAGAAIGIAIARHLAISHDSEHPSRTAAKGARRPIDVTEDLGDDSLVNGFGLPINRGRAPAFAEDDRADDFLYMAPLPGPDDGDPFATAQEDEEPFELSNAFEAPADMHEPVDLQPLAFVAPSLSRRAMPALVEDAAIEPLPRSFRRDLLNAPLEELGLAQLVERLEASLERRRLRLASIPATALSASADFEPAAAEEAAQAIAAYFGKPTGIAGLPDAAQSAPRPFHPSAEPAFAARADTDAALRAALATLQKMSRTA